jgi:hypothetical protein
MVPSQEAPAVTHFDAGFGDNRIVDAKSWDAVEVLPQLLLHLDDQKSLD